MSGNEKKDTVLCFIRDSVRQFGMIDDGPMGRQTLLLGDDFYGYRFTAKEFTAIWSAADETLNLFDQSGRRIGSSLVSFPEEKISDPTGTIRLADHRPIKKAA